MKWLTEFNYSVQQTNNIFVFCQIGRLFIIHKLSNNLALYLCSILHMITILTFTSLWTIFQNNIVLGKVSKRKCFRAYSFLPSKGKTLSLKTKGILTLHLVPVLFQFWLSKRLEFVPVLISRSLVLGRRGKEKIFWKFRISSIERLKGVLGHI